MVPGSSVAKPGSGVAARRSSLDFASLNPGYIFLLSVHRHHDAADGPEHRIFAAADIPQPFALGDTIYRDGGDREVQRRQRGHKGGEYPKDQADREHNLDGAGKI